MNFIHFFNEHVFLLARIQFAFTIAFHIIFPAFTIGLASWLAILEGLWLKTKNSAYKDLYQFWVKIFAVAFGMGVVSGIVMSYEFGTNWSVFADKSANVIGPLLGYEVLTAFFLEASFLGIMLFGWNRVSNKMHFVSTCVVAIGTLFSTFWILAANSWMQTPQGFELHNDGRFYPVNWFEVIFNPSFPYRFFHMVTGAYLTTACVVVGVGAWYLYKKRHQELAKIMLRMSVLLIFFLAPLQIILGDLHGLNTLKHQPLKIAAIEGIWETEKGAPLHLFAIPDTKNERNNFNIEIPYAGSLILTHTWDGEIKGLKEWNKEDRPSVPWVFFSFRIMVGAGVLMLLLGIIGGILFLRKRLYLSAMFHRYCIAMAPAGFIAIISGWFVAEIGRQPYIVYGVLKTRDALSPVLGAYVALSLGIFILLYSFIFGAAIYYIFKLIRTGPKNVRDEDTYGAHGLDRPPIL